MTWTFNKNYRDTGQVRQFMPAYMERYAELAAAGKYPYNDSFRGHIGAEGPDEDTAIYLCQTLRSLDELSEQVATALADGFRLVDGPPEETTKFARVIEFGW